MSFQHGLKAILRKNPRDVVIVSAIRSPITRAKKGGLANMAPEEMLSAVLKSTLELSKVEPVHVQDVVVGAVLQTLGGQKASAMAVKHAGFPVTTTTMTVNRQCSSSAQAVSQLAAQIFTQQIDCGIAAGTESMSMDYFATRGIPHRISNIFSEGPVSEAQDVLLPMGITSENVANECHISRSDQDDFALRSHQKAATAQQNGWFTEIVKVKARQVEEGKMPIWLDVTKDDGVRSNITLEKLAKLAPAFAENGTSTAGNSSQISDGASAILLMSREKADMLGLKPLGKFVNSVVSGVPARVMGIAPAYAIPKLLSLTGIAKDEVDLWELNEAFASQSLHVIRSLDINMEQVNVHGGAIALGHPLGATGARCIATLLGALQRLDKRIGVVSMCASTGQGKALMLARE